MSSTEGSVDLAGLPEAVRSRVVSLTSDAIGRLPPEQLPGPLRRLAAFTPSKRARLAAPQILAALSSDPEFRDRVGEQLRSSLDAARHPATNADEAAAAAYLMQTPDRTELLAARAAGVAPEPAAADPDAGDEPAAEASRSSPDRGDATDGTLRRLRDRLARTQEQLERQRVQIKSEVERVKTENRGLRRKLGETRARLRAVESERDAARDEAAAQSTVAARTATASDAEVRRLRARVAELEHEVGLARRVGRSERLNSTVRARLLLDTLGDAAQGLRRELGLPAVDRLPADLLRAEEPGLGVRPSTGHGSLAEDDPRMLEELLRLPRAHVVVDGYNLTKQAWPELPLDRQRDRLLSGLAGLLARSGAEVTVIFDAAETEDRPLIVVPRGLRVRFSPFGVIADDVIRDLLHLEPPGRPVVVATRDRALGADVVASGFRVVPAPALARLLSRT